MYVWSVLHAARSRWKYRTQKNRHFGTIAQLCWAVSSQLRHVSTIGKKIVKRRYLLHMFLVIWWKRPTNGWDLLASLGQTCKFQQLVRLGSVTARHSSSGRQPNFVVLNRGRHLYLAGRPSRWALAHILFSYKSVSTTIEGTSVLLWPLLTNHNFVYPSKHHAVDTNFFCLSLT